MKAVDKHPTFALAAAAVFALSSSAARAETTIDLIWHATGTNEIFDPAASARLVLDVVLTTGPATSLGGAITVDYGEAVGILTFVSATSDPDGAFTGTTVGEPTDTGTQVRNVGAFSPFDPVAPNTSVRLGSIAFHKEALDPTDSITLSTLSTATDGVDGLTLPSSFGTAMLINLPGSSPTPLPPTPTPTPPTPTPPTPTPGPPVQETAIRLIWQDTGTNEIVDPVPSSEIILDIILEVDERESHGGGITVDYSEAGKFISVVGFSSNPDDAFPLVLGTTIDTGTQVRNINGYNPFGPLAGNFRVRLGSIVFHKDAPNPPDFATLTTLYTATDAIDGLNLPSSFGTARLINITDPTPTPTPPTATPTPTPIPTCVELNPVTTIVTVAKGQSPDNNAKVSHAITGNIIDPGSLSSTAHRIDVCTGTAVSVVVIDSTGTPTNTAGGSLVCDSTSCSGTVNETERYRSVSQDGQDKDRIALIPMGEPPPECPCWTESELDAIPQDLDPSCQANENFAFFDGFAGESRFDFVTTSTDGPDCLIHSDNTFLHRSFIIEIIDYFVCRNSIIAECESRGIPIQ